MGPHEPRIGEATAEPPVGELGGFGAWSSRGSVPRLVLRRADGWWDVVPGEYCH
jgi:hypothetical protein